MSDKIESVNVEDIMKKIRENIAARGETEDILSFNEKEAGTEIKGIVPGSVIEFDEDELSDAVQSAFSFHNIPYYEPFEGNQAKVLVKRVGRKAMAFQMHPLRDRQNQFNYYAARSLQLMEAREAAFEEIILEQNKKIKALEERLAKLEKIGE